MSASAIPLSGGLNVSGAVSVTRSDSSRGARRKTATITARRCLAAAQALTPAKLTASEPEERFVREYNAAVRALCDGDDRGCVAALAKLRADFPGFCTDNAAASRAAVGPLRCDAGIIRAELSIAVLQRQCELAADPETRDNAFVFSASEK